MIYKHFLIKLILSEYFLNDLHKQIYQFMGRDRTMKIIAFWLTYFDQVKQYLHLHENIINPVLYHHTYNNSPEQMLQFIDYYIYFCVTLHHLNIHPIKHVDVLNQFIYTLTWRGYLAIQETNLGIFTNIDTHCYSIIELKTYNFTLIKQYAKKWYHLYHKTNYGMIYTARKRYQHGDIYTKNKMIKLIKDEYKFYKQTYLKNFVLYQEHIEAFTYQGEIYYRLGSNKWYYINNNEKIYIDMLNF